MAEPQIRLRGKTWHVRYRAANGVRIERSLKTTDRDVALRRAAEMRPEDGDAVQAAYRTLVAYVEANNKRAALKANAASWRYRYRGESPMKIKIRRVLRRYRAMQKAIADGRPFVVGNPHHENKTMRSAEL